MNIWAVVAAAGVVTLTALATAWAQSRIGTSISAALAEKPELGAQAVIMVAIPETMVILGFVVAVLIIMRAGGAG
jgi:V/A-type H+/Na+-transporting ATPase subunit K